MSEAAGEGEGGPYSAEYLDLARTYAEAFGSAAGRQVLDDLVARYDNRPSYVPGFDLGQTAHRDGERNVVRRIRALLELAAAPRVAARGVDAPAVAETGETPS